MSVLTEPMSSFFLFLNLFFLVCYVDVDAFHVDKPMIYINLFDEVVTDNGSSTLSDKGSPTTLTPLKKVSHKDLHALDQNNLSPDHLKLHDENKTSASELSDTVFAFDLPYKADITEISANKSDRDQSTTAAFPDLIDPEFIETELTRMFFLRAIANMIEHILVALFAVEEPPTLNTPPLDYYESAPSRNIKKRDLSVVNDISKLSDEEQTVKQNSESKTASSHLKNEGAATEELSSLSWASESEHSKSSAKLVEHTEHSSHSPLHTSVSDHTSSYHGTQESTVKKSHASKRENEVIRDKHEADNISDGKSLRGEKLIAHQNAAVQPEPFEDDMFPFKDESPVLNDEVVNKKEPNFYEGIHPAEDHDELVENAADKEHSTGSLVERLVVVGTVVLILVIFGALAVAAAYVIRKGQEAGNQNAANLHSSLA